MADRPDVSIIVPSIGTTGEVHGSLRTFVVDAVRSAVATADVPVEVVVVAGREMPRSVEAALLDIGPVRLVPYDAAFNFSATINLGAAHASGRYLLMLNDDTEVVSADWLVRMLDAAAAPGVGAVGARLLFEDGTLQHAGHTYRTSLDHVGFGLPADDAGRTGLLKLRREVAGVTAACLLTPAEVFDAVGGLCTGFPGNYNDVDYCMKVRFAGWRIVYEPAAVLHHYESRSRVAGIEVEEVELVQRRWRTLLEDDPFTPVTV